MSKRGRNRGAYRQRASATSPISSSCRSPANLAIWSAVSFALQCAANLAEAAPPPLPTPCVGAPCGTGGNRSFVQSGQATAVSSGNSLTVNQTSNAAVLNWRDFNIANGYNVKFNQPGATSAALNRIWSADPSVIAGKLDANGQIYLINQNGIIFDRGAQVNVGSLTASTLDITDELFKNGILSQNTDHNSPDTQPPVFQAGAGQTGGVVVNEGATLTTTDGGRVMLLGSAVLNRGTIKTPGGQTIMGAGKTVYLAASTDPALRGLLIEVDSATADSAAAAGANTVTNQGQISADRGNVTLAGLIVNQSGQISATTSVSANGSIYLVAGDTASTSDPQFYDRVDAFAGFGTMLPNNGGTLTLSPGSKTEIGADPTDTATISGTQAQSFIPSQIGLVGKTVVMQGNATIRAPGASVTVTAAADPFARVDRKISPDTPDGSRIYLDSGSTIDSAGLQEVPISVTRNLLQVRLTGNDLQDDPLLRDGFLHGQTVTVNALQPSPLFNLDPYIANIGHGIAELLTAGGSIRMDSSGDLIARAGSVLNLSGGSIAYQGGYGPSTTQLLGANGKVYDISKAPNNIQYIGFANSYSYTDPTWGTQTNMTAQRQYAGFTQGANAGTLLMLSPQLYVRGSMLANTVTGPFQRQLLPKGGTFIVGDSTVVGSTTVSADHRAPDVTLADGSQDELGGSFDALSSTLPMAAQLGTVLSPTQLTQSGFNNIGIYSNGVVTLPATSNLTLTGGSFTALGQAVQIDGRICGPGSAVNLTAATFIRGPDVETHDVVLGAGSVIDVTGNWVNDSPKLSLELGTAPILKDGGTVSIAAADNVRLGEGSLIDVSGGGWIQASNALSVGNAGKISLSANSATRARPPYEGTLQLSGTLRGASLPGGTGGTLSIQAGSVTVGPTGTGGPGELVLGTDFFRAGGFSQYNITGQNGVLIGTADQPVSVDPIRLNLVFNENSLLKPTGSALESFSSLELLPDYLRAPASVSFAANANPEEYIPGIGDVVLSPGSSIVTDPGASVALAAAGYSGNLRVFGSIIDPAGTISLTLGGTAIGQGGDLAVGYLPDQQILLGPQAVLSANGYAQINTNNTQGYRQGSVLDGGKVTITANKGYVVADGGSLIDVSGAAGTLDILQSTGVTATLVAGNAGTIQINAREGIALSGQLKGTAAPVAGAAGGSLSIGLDLFNYTETGEINTLAGVRRPYPTGPRVLTLTDQPASALSTALRNGSATLSTETLQSGGFDNITLKSTDVIALNGALSLSAKGSLTLDAPVLQGGAGGRANLSAPHVVLGNFYNNPSATQETITSPAAGDATLNVSASLIDVRGSSAMAGFSDVTLASSGDIRLTFPQNLNPTAPYLTGSLTTSGDLVLQASQVYPTTFTQFTINSPGKVTVLSGSVAPTVTPLTAGGWLRINAADIVQQGVLRAPLGQIELNGSNSVLLDSGSITSVSANGQTIPFGSTQNGLSWVYSIVGRDIPFTAPPAKNISVTAPSATIASGATVDLSGGGDLYAYEFIAGPGGSKDVLSAATTGSYTYAIVPGLGSQYAPIDLQYMLGTNQPADRNVYISGVPGLANGYYALLPARYALLPGAYAVQLVKGNSDVAAGAAVRQPDGSYLVSAQFGSANSGAIDSRTSTIVVAPGTVVRSRSQYSESYADVFFSNAAAINETVTPKLPADAGQLVLAATDSLALAGTIKFAPADYVAGKDANGKPITQHGLGGDVAIIAPQISVVDQVGDPTGALQVTASSLDALGAQTLILGATRQTTADGDLYTVGSQVVELKNTAANVLSAPEIILAGTESVTLDAGSAISATGTSSAKPNAILVKGDGAMLRVSNGTSAPIKRTEVSPGPIGTLMIGSGASVSATGSLLLDGTADTILAPDASISASAVTISSSHISLGDVPTGTGGLSLTPGLLAGLRGLTDLDLTSSSTIDLYGSVQLGSMDSASGKPVLQSVVFDSAGINGYGAGDKNILAGAVTIENLAGSSVAPSTPADGTGALNVTVAATGSKGSGQITLGKNTTTVSGFGGTNLKASGDIQGDQTGNLLLTGAGDLNLQAARLTTSSGADTQITNTTGAVNILASSGSGSSITAAPVGGKLGITGTSIVAGGTIALPAGILTLHATGPQGDVSFGSGALTSVAGTAVQFFDTYAAAPGGHISLISDNGNVALASGAVLDVSGITAPDGKTRAGGGSLSVSAAHGQFQFDGSMKGNADASVRQADFTLDAAGINNFSALNAALNTGGFHGAISERARDGDITVAAGDTVTASSFSLCADAGSINVAGTINTSGGSSFSPDGGSIDIWAGGNLNLVSGAKLLADAGAPTQVNPSARGGEVTLGTSHGTLSLASGASISQKGSTASEDGQLTLRAPRTASGSDVAINPVATSINSSKPVVVEGFKVYQAATLSDSGDFGDTLSVGTDGMMFTDALAFTAASAAISDRLGLSNAQVRAGIEVQSTGDLTLDSRFDLANVWRSGGVPVANLTLRAAGNLIFKSSLTDGFTTTSPLTNLTRWTLASDDSASYRLVSGSDLAAANPLSVQVPSALTPNSGNFILTPGNLIRTGNGSIHIAAGGDVRLGYDPDFGDYLQPNAQASVIYTAGVPYDLSDSQKSFFPVPTLTGGVKPAYPTGGGDISIDAAGSVISAPTAQLVSDWLWRRGQVSDGTITSGQNTSWWIMFSNFQQGVGALGGGDLSIKAGADIVNLSAVVPSNGRLIGAAGTAPEADNLIVAGSGSLSVSALGNIASGVFEVDQGNARISSGGALTYGRTNIDTNPGGDSTPVYPILITGNGIFDVSARTDLTIEGIANSTMLPETTANFTAMRRHAAFFNAYTAASSLNLLSTAGDITLADDTDLISKLAPEGTYSTSGFDISNYAVQPPNLSLAALSGSAVLDDVRIFPAATGNLTVLAREDIVPIQTVRMFEADPANMPSPLAPGDALDLSTIGVPTEPLHAGDTVPIRLIAADGSITGAQGAVGATLVFPKAAELVAGKNITDLTYRGKNLSPSDVTLFEAGGNISYATLTDPTTNALVTNSRGIEVGGPGYVEVLAGHALDLGDGNGVITTGSLNDSRLSATGATLVAGAGFGANADGGLRAPAYTNFIQAYLEPDAKGNASAYASKLVSFMQQLNPARGNGLSYSSALSGFESLSRAQQLPFLTQVLSDELSATGIAHNTEGTDYSRGYKAIDTLFPAKDAQGQALSYHGDINMFFSQLKTEQGGDVDMLAPGGSVIVGLPNPPAALTAAKSIGGPPPVPAAANLGALVLGSGAIHGFADQDFTVNQSRMLTLEGGDIILWASNGNIDAGRGAKSASGTPAPIIQTDAQGNVFVNPLNAVSGSGIGQLIDRPDRKAGLVNLIAPKGDVNAGDAGIRVAGNLNIAAVAVLGVSNITVGGTATGVPVSEAGALSGALSGANSLGDAGKNAAEQLASNLGSAANFQQLTDSLQPAFIVVRMFCLGVDCEVR